MLWFFVLKYIIAEKTDLFSIYIRLSFTPTKGRYWQERLPVWGHILRPPRILTFVYLNISFLKDAAFLDAAVREREEELSRRTLQALLDMRIKFPGKTDEEAEVILDNVSVERHTGCFSVELQKIAVKVYSPRGLTECGIIVQCCFSFSFRFKITGSFISQEWPLIGWWSWTQ